MNHLRNNDVMKSLHTSDISMIFRFRNRNQFRNYSCFWLESESKISKCFGIRIGTTHWSPGIGIGIRVLESEWNQRIFQGIGSRIRNFKNAGIGIWIGIKMYPESCITASHCRSGQSKLYRPCQDMSTYLPEAVWWRLYEFVINWHGVSLLWWPLCTQPL